MANKIMYQIVGRYMDGKEVIAYHMVSPETGKSQKFTKEQTYFLVGKGSVTNCSGQIYQDKVLLRGIGCDLNSLPVQNVSGGMQRTGSVGHIRRGDTAEDVMNKVNVVKAIVQGRNTIGYVLQNNGGGTAKVTRQQMFELAKAGKLGNVRYQESNGKPILRGVGINLNQLPTETVGNNTAESAGNATTNDHHKEMGIDIMAVKTKLEAALAKNGIADIIKTHLDVDVNARPKGLIFYHAYVMNDNMILLCQGSSEMTIKAPKSMETAHGNIFISQDYELVATAHTTSEAAKEIWNAIKVQHKKIMQMRAANSVTNNTESKKLADKGIDLDLIQHKLNQLIAKANGSNTVHVNIATSERSSDRALQILHSDCYNYIILGEDRTSTGGGLEIRALDHMQRVGNKEVAGNGWKIIKTCYSSNEAVEIIWSLIKSQSRVIKRLGLGMSEKQAYATN